jgi:hypothetical protein
LDREIVRERQDRNGLAVLRDLPDDAPVRIPDGFEEEVPYGTYASTLEELRRVIRESAVPFLGLDPADYEDDIAHEAEHAAAARAIGCASRFLFKRAPHPVRDDVWCSVTVHVYASSEPLTKLAVASIAAAPSWMSDTDLADLQCMGYRDVEDVAARIQASGQRLPVPLSVTAGKARQCRP